MKLSRTPTETRKNTVTKCATELLSHTLLKCYHTHPSGTLPKHSFTMCYYTQNTVTAHIHANELLTHVIETLSHTTPLIRPQTCTAEKFSHATERHPLTHLSETLTPYSMAPTCTTAS